MTQLFLDTSVAYAALVANDAHHQASKAAVSDALTSRDVTLLTTSLVLLETMALLQARVGLDAALDFDQKLRPHLDVVWVDQALYGQAVRRLELRASRRVSLVDCASFVVMESHCINQALTLDRHFIDEGFVALPEGPQEDS